MIGRKNKFIFIHIPKTAGQSVANALMPHTLHPHQRFIQRIGRHIGRNVKYDHYRLHIDHSDVIDYQNILTPEIYSKYFSFTFVRNPYDRVLSMYSFTKKRPKSPLFEVATKGTFDDFITALSKRGFKQQVDYLYDAKRNINVNFIGRFENLESDFLEIGRKLKIDINLGHKNASKHSSYHEVYTEWGRNEVARLSKDDIKQFDYKFDPR